MGVKDLWGILSPISDRKPLFELQGKAVAVDLSGWVVSCQTIPNTGAHLKMHLRNLYFRADYLLMQGILPVFVLEGKAPTLKHKTISRRNEIQRGTSKTNATERGGRTRFNFVLRQCKELLSYMGLPCVEGLGEAEATCAYLNEDGVVEGIITQDTDCFLYGARKVYRNFCISTQSNQTSSSGHVDLYDMDKIESAFRLGRRKMISLALLCGCDYNEGVKGVGKESALKLFELVKDEDILERMKSWRANDKFKRMRAGNPTVCTSCGHKGSVKAHGKAGCTDCDTVKKCNDAYKNEVNLMKKALLVEDFPSQELIDEFLIRKDPTFFPLDIKWKQPCIEKFIAFMEHHLGWERDYSFDKFFPLATRWQLLHLPEIIPRNRLHTPNFLIADSIRKIRNRRGVPSYEILWKDEHDLLGRLQIESATGIESESSPRELVTIEPQIAVQKCYPELIEAFENANAAKTKAAKSRKKKPVVANDGNSDETRETNVKKPKKRGKAKALVEANNRKIDDFISKDNCLQVLTASLESLTITPKRAKDDTRCDMIVSHAKSKETEIESIISSSKKKLSSQLEEIFNAEENRAKLNKVCDMMVNEISIIDTDSEAESDDFNLSEIVDRICSKQTFQHIPISNLQKSADEGLLKIDSPCQSPQKDEEHTHNTTDEFAEIEVYVPLNERVHRARQKNQRKSFSILESSKKKSSFGVTELMASDSDD